MTFEFATATRIIFGPGETRDVPDAKARELLRDFPTNFVRVIEVATTEIPSAPVDRMMRKGRTKRK